MEFDEAASLLKKGYPNGYKGNLQALKGVNRFLNEHSLQIYYSSIKSATFST